MIVCRQPEVALDARAERKSGVKGGKRVFRNVGSVVQAPMRVARRTGIEGIRP